MKYPLATGHVAGFWPARLVVCTAVSYPRYPVVTAGGGGLQIGK